MGIKQSNEKPKKINLERINKLKAHIEYVNYLCFLPPNNIASCSSDKTIKIFSLSNYICEMTLIGHSSWVNFVKALPKNRLLSCSHDKTIKIWALSLNTHSYVCEYTFEEKDKEIDQAINISKNRLLSVSYWDNSIQMYHFNPPYAFIGKLNHDFVKCVIETKNRSFLISGGLNKTIIWGPSLSSNESFDCVNVFNEVECNSNCSLVELSENYAACAGEKTIFLIDIIKKNIAKKIGVSFPVFSILDMDEHIICGDEQGGLYLIDFGEERCLKVKSKAHKGKINCLVKLSKNEFASSSLDKSIRIWKF